MAVDAVATTGIYCRAECSATPLPRNTSTYATPIAAEAAGYRACLRCRPDRHVRSVEVTHAPVPVKSAVTLIAGGFLDRFDETDLAARVGYSPRHLRRLFEHHVGATPDFVARSRRAHFARRLLDETDLSMTAIAGAAGFGSARQMHRVVEQIFGFTPSALRAKRHTRDVLAVDGGLRLRIPTATPLDVDHIVGHLQPRLTPGVESLEGTVYRRTVENCGHPGVVEIDLAAGTDAVELVAHLPSFDSIIDEVARVRHLFGLDDDLQDASEHLARDPALGRLVRQRPDLRVIGGWDRFETAVRVIVGQQVSVAGATTTTGGLIARHGTALPAPALGLTHLFPTPEQLVVLAFGDTDEGMPRRRAITIGALAHAVVDGRATCTPPTGPTAGSASGPARSDPGPPTSSPCGPPAMLTCSRPVISGSGGRSPPSTVTTSCRPKTTVAIAPRCGRPTARSPPNTCGRRWRSTILPLRRPCDDRNR